MPPRYLRFARTLALVSTALPAPVIAEELLLGCGGEVVPSDEGPGPTAGTSSGYATGTSSGPGYGTSSGPYLGMGTSGAPGYGTSGGPWLGTRPAPEQDSGQDDAADAIADAGDGGGPGGGIPELPATWGRDA